MKQKNAYKIKLIKILEILRQDTDEDNYMKSTELIAKLKAMGIDCDRRTLYNDIQVLNDYGYEVFCEQHPSKPNEYCIPDKEFSVPELRILMDAVESASFITTKKTMELADKIAALGGSHKAELLKNDSRYYNTTKHSNESIYYSINEIVLAIEQDKKVSFLYFDYDAKKNRVYRKEGKRYYINPYSLVINNDNYYLVGYNDYYNKIVHYRVDRMAEVRISHYDRVGKEFMDDFDLSSHQKSVFGMYTGEECEVTIETTTELIDVMMDKFGEDTKFFDKGNDIIEFKAAIQCSPQFFGWCLSFGDKLKIKAPIEVVDQLKEYINGMVKNYD